MYGLHISLAVLPQKTVVYDAHYALRLCLEHHLNEACVHIYSAMGLYEEALDLALEV